MMYTCISLIVHPPFEIPGSAPGTIVSQSSVLTILHWIAVVNGCIIRHR